MGAKHRIRSNQPIAAMGLQNLAFQVRDSKVTLGSSSRGTCHVIRQLFHGAQRAILQRQQLHSVQGIKIVPVHVPEGILQQENRVGRGGIPVQGGAGIDTRVSELGIVDREMVSHKCRRNVAAHTSLLDQRTAYLGVDYNYRYTLFQQQQLQLVQVLRVLHWVGDSAHDLGVPAGRAAIICFHTARVGSARVGIAQQEHTVSQREVGALLQITPHDQARLGDLRQHMLTQHPPSVLLRQRARQQIENVVLRTGGYCRTAAAGGGCNRHGQFHQKFSIERCEHIYGNAIIPVRTQLGLTSGVVSTPDVAPIATQLPVRVHMHRQLCGYWKRQEAERSAA